MAEAWLRTEPTVSLKIGWPTVVLKTFRQPGKGRPRSYTTFHAEGAACTAVIALTDDNRVVIARQFRPGPERIMDELPGGSLEMGEDPLQGALRELREETGYVPGRIIPLGTSSRDAYVNAPCHYFLATGCVADAGGQQLDDHEYVDVVLISIAELIENAMQDRMTDPHAVLMAYERLKSMQEEE